MKPRVAAGLGVTLVVVVACAGPARPPEAQVTLPPAPSSPASTATPTPVSTCGAQPAYARPTIEPTCTEVALKNGDHWHDQLTLQLSSGATTRIDCPRMRFLGKDTPVCVTGIVGGQLRGACCPPGHRDPTDPECVAEGSVDEMFKRQKVWEWCSKTTPQARPCEPCVWVTGAER
jgi:hypothetical protein